MPKETKHDRQTVMDAIKGEGQFASDNPKKLSSSFGNVTNIAQRLHVSRTTVEAYRKKWAGVDDAIIYERETLKDFVESKMAERIMGGSDTMMIFYAKTQMKDRGYVERQEVTGADGADLTIQYVNVKRPED